jgi:cell wall-associated NlpC family hydrolase
MIEKYLGKPFVDGGRGPDGYDCWGLVLAIYRNDFGVRIPLDYDISAYATMAVVRAFSHQMTDGDWTLLTTPATPSVLGLAMHPEHPDLVNHCGVYLGKGLMIHALKPTGVVVQRTDDPRIKGRIKGYYAWTGMTT